MGLLKNNILVNNMIVILLSIMFSILAAEAILRVKNSSMNNYDIEMWRYSNELKTPSKNKSIGHIHKTNTSAILQSVEIRTNSLGLRGTDIVLECCEKKILLLGSSITLGWGVEERNTISERLNESLKGRYSVLNAGVGNYNTVRYVNNFIKNLSIIKPEIIIIQYFVNDAEKLEVNSGNLFLQKSQLAVILWSAFHKFKSIINPTTLEDYYQSIYSAENIGFIEMKSSLDKIKLYAEKNNVRIILAMTPDIHSLNPYNLKFVHDIMRKESLSRGFEFIDLLDAFKNVFDTQSIWAMPGDPHPNSLGHELMANHILNFLE
jgi:hypothetical protein